MRNIVPCFPWPVPPAAQRVLDGIPDIKPVEALAGMPGPVLSLRKAPDFICDAIVISHPDAIEHAVRLIVGDGMELVTVRGRVTEIMGLPEDDPLVERWESTQTVRFQ